MSDINSEFKLAQFLDSLDRYIESSRECRMKTHLSRETNDRERFFDGGYASACDDISAKIKDLLGKKADLIKMSF